MSSRHFIRHAVLAGLSAVLLSAMAPAQAALKVFACEPEWASLARELAGPQATIYTATTALQDPHHAVQSGPQALAALRSADLLVCTGAELESGWLPALLRQSGNSRVQDGQPGHFEASVFVTMQEAPARVDLAGSDLHAQGNPHISTAPSTFTTVARALAYRLAEVDGDNASVYKTRLADFQARWAVANERWSLAAAPLKGQRVAVQHDGFPYLVQWLGLQQVAVLEAKPGVEPGHDDLALALKQVQLHPVRLVMRAAYSEGRSAAWLAEQAHVPVVVLPSTVGGSERAKDLFGLFDDTVDQLLKGLRH